MASISSKAEVGSIQQDAIDTYRIPFQTARAALLKLVKLAALTFDAPMAAIALADRKVSPIDYGFSGSVWKEDMSPTTLGSHDIQVIPDARLEREWLQHPMVTGAPYLRFWASAPLRSPTGVVLGTLVVADRVPRAVGGSQMDSLVTLSQQAMAQLQLQQRSTVVSLAPPLLMQAPTAPTGEPPPTERYLKALAIVQHQLLVDMGGNDLYGSVLELLGHVSGASRIYVFENHRSRAGQIFMNQRAEWCARDIQPQIQNPDLQNLPAPEWTKSLATGMPINLVVSDLPPSDRVILDEQGILALLLVPLTVRNEFFGFIGFDNCTDATPWAAAEVNFLSAAAAAISIALENRTAQLALQQQEAFLACAMDAQLSGEWTWNAIADEIVFNSTMVSLLGGSEAGMPSSWAAWCACIHPDDRTRWTQALQAHIQHPEQEFRCERRLLISGERTRWFRTVGRSRINECGHLESLTAIETDITESTLSADLQRSLERVRTLESRVAEMERGHRSQDDFFCEVAHELRSPVANMKLSIQMLKLAADADRRDRYLDILERECAREIELIDDLFDLQRLDDRNEGLALRTIRLSEWLAPIVQPFRLRAERRHIQFDLKIVDAAISTEAPSLQRLLDELLDNACRYTPPEGTIEFSAIPTGQSMSFAIHNTGNEISPEHLALIFDRFYRVPNRDRSHVGGTGLGLTLAKRLAERLQGRISASSSCDRTSFLLDLPFAIAQSGS